MNTHGACHLSYSVFEADFAFRLAVDLKNAGIAVWFDRMDTAHEREWAAANASALGRASTLICALSTHYIQSNYTRAELDYAIANQLNIVTLLTSAIPQTSWPSEVPRGFTINFNDWRDPELYAQSFEHLLMLLDELGIHPAAVPDDATRYLNDLVAQIEMRRANLEFVDISESSDIIAADIRPLSRLKPVWGVPGRVILREPVPSADGLWRTHVGLSLSDAAARHPRLVIVGSPAIGKTTIVERFVLDTAYALLAGRRDRGLPVLLSLSQWDDDTETIEEFIRSSWRLPGDPLALLKAGHADLYLDGLNELGAAGQQKAAHLRAWLSSADAPAQAIITCRSGDYAGALDLGLPIVEVRELDDAAIEQFVQAYLGPEKAAGLLSLLFPAEERADDAFPLALLARSPGLLFGLVFLYRISPHTDLPHSVGAIYKRLLASLWLWKRMTQMPGWLPFKEMESALSRLALEMLRADLPAALTYNEVLEALGNEAFLAAGRNAGLLLIDNQHVRFASVTVQAYFAAISMTRADLQSTLSSPRFTERGLRIATRWDEAILMMAGMAPNPEYLIRDIAEVDPFLASACIASGASVSHPIYNSIVEVLTGYARAGDSEGRVAAALSLDMIGQNAAPLLLEMMRQGPFPVRQAAAWALADAGTPVPQDMLKALRNWDWNADERVGSALRGVGSSAVPVLLEVLRDEHWAKRRGAAWALGEIADPAAVPGLIEALYDDDALVRREAAIALRAMQDPHAAEALVRALSDQEKAVRKAASEALSAYSATVVPLIVEALAGARPETQIACAEALGRIGGSGAVHALIELSYAENPEIRGAAVEALGRIGSPEVLPRLAECLRDHARANYEEMRISDRARDALNKMGTPEAMAALEMARRAGALAPEPTPDIPERKRPQARAAQEPQRLPLPQALRGLSHSDWQVRFAAAQSLADYDDPRAVTGLIGALRDEDNQVRWAAVRSLERHSGDSVIRALLYALRDKDYLVSDSAAEALGRMGARAVPGLIDALSDPSVDVRGAAIDALGQIADPASVPALIRCLNDNNRPNREIARIADRAADVLERIGTPQALTALAAWRDRAVQLAASAAEPAKPNIPDGRKASPARETAWSSLDQTIEALHSPDWHTKLAASKQLRLQAKNLRGLDDPAVIERLAGALRDRESAVRWAAVEALAWIRDPASLPMLLETLHDKHWTIRLAVIRALVEIGHATAVPALLEALRDRQASIREAAAEAVGRLAVGPEAIPNLQAALADPEGFVRRAVVEALGEIGDKTVTPSLIEMLEDSDSQVRWAAIEALGKLGDPAAVEPLIGQLHDVDGPSWEDRRICDIAADVLESIGTPEAMAAVARWRQQASRVPGKQG